MNTNELKIICEDNHLIGVIKPFNVLAQKDKTGDMDMVDMVKGYLKDKYNKPGNVYLGLVHRLDRPAGGVMIFARTSKAAARLSKQFREHSVKKKYWAWLEGWVEQDYAKMESYLKKDKKANKVAVFDKHHKGALKAELEYRVKKRERTKTLIEINLFTGRPHQIRAQMAHIDHPVLGDIKYGASKPLKGKNIALFSYYLSFEHPISKKEMVLEAEPDTGWDM